MYSPNVHVSNLEYVRHYHALSRDNQWVIDGPFGIHFQSLPEAVDFDYWLDEISTSPENYAAVPQLVEVEDEGVGVDPSVESMGPGAPAR